MSDSLTADDAATLQSIQEATLSTLTATLGTTTRAVLLDFPRHRNAGDSLIWTGELAYLRRLGIDIVYSSDIYRFDEDQFDKHRQDSVVLLTGGGSFGDLWPAYHEFREHVVRRSSGSKVVVMPQSIHFVDRERAAQTNKLFAEHGDTTVLLRDHESMARAAELLPDVQIKYCPDMAFGNSPFLPKSPRHDFLYLSRSDHEKSVSGDLLLPNARGPIDWGEGMSRKHNLQWKAAITPGALYRRTGGIARTALLRPTVRANEVLARTNVASGIRLLSEGNVIITDRLHAHVFALLMGRPHVVMDNTYGKISAVFRAYSGQFSTANLATDLEEARLVAASLSQHTSTK